MTVEIIPVRGLPEVEPGDDLASLLAPPLLELGSEAGDVVLITQKVVSKSEGRIVPEDEGRETWVRRETRRVVARRGDLVIAETRHGLVCANAGVDASNVAAGCLTLLPEDPDGSAEAIRVALRDATGADLGVIITDTFGRPWREGLVDVAIGCAGVPALVDLRGTADHHGRKLEATVEALADAVAAAGGLVMGKADRVPAALVKGLGERGRPGRARDVIRAPQDDLFRESPLQSISARRSIRSFGTGGVPRESLREAVRAACTAPAPHHTQPWLFVVLDSGPARRRLLGAMAGAWRRDLEGDGTPPEVIDRRLRGSDALLAAAPALIVPAVRTKGSHAYPDAARADAEREMFLLSGGAAIQNLMLALHAQGLASCWVSSTLFCKRETREALGLQDEWIPLGSVAVGPAPQEVPPPRPEIELGDHLRYERS